MFMFNEQIYAALNRRRWLINFVMKTLNLQSERIIFYCPLFKFYRLTTL